MAFDDNNNNYQNPMNGQNDGYQPPEYDTTPPQQNYNQNQQYYQPPYPAQNQPQQYPMYSQPKTTTGFDVASLVCGILSFFCCGYIAGILAIIFAFVAKSKNPQGKFSGLALGGLICGIIGLVLTLGITFWSITTGTYRNILNNSYYSYF